jgi:hypothetical protein
MAQVEAAAACAAADEIVIDFLELDGVMEAQDAAVFNKMHDANADFHYQIFKSEHGSYYGARDL